MNDRVTVDIKDGVADVRLVRTDKMNALDNAMFDALIATGERLKSEPGVRAVVLSGDGRAFCAGLDMGNFQAMASGERSGGQGTAGALVTRNRTPGGSNRAQHAVMVWREIPVPVIAAVHGVCFGGGLQIASGADIRIVHPATRMAIMEMKWGLVPDMGGYALWRGLVRDDVLRELIYTNREFSGAEAQTLGLATYVDENPRERALEIARTIALKNPHAIRAAKRLQADMHERDTDAILMEESIEQHGIMRSRNQVEAVMAEMERRTPKFEDV
jgi:enoyl-CoA hydratase/carnithine racemase